MFMYDVDLHFKGVGWDTYCVMADCVDNARYAAVQRVIDEIGVKQAETIDCVRVYKHNTDKLVGVDDMDNSEEGNYYE